ncbi:MAG: restriction endonuclease [Blastocatellia bacterium]|nr:restriction endonuclease [Blastocatellia bacterium]
MISTELKSHFAKIRVIGQGSDRISLSASEIAWLLYLAADDLKLELCNNSFKVPQKQVPSFYDVQIPPALPKQWEDLTTDELLIEFDWLIRKEPDVRLYFSNLCEILKRRIKYQRILSRQPKPTMDQIGPRSLLEYGIVPMNLLATWLTWRKWVFDVDNRSGQETGYLFEPVLASCIGGTTVGSRNSPVKRINENGKQTTEGRQIDCLDVEAKIAYEFKLRVTIAASGQGRFAEELSFPVECKAAGLTPVLIVLDPTPSARLAELRRAFEASGGEVHSKDAWEFIEQKAGKCMSTFLENYLRPVLLRMAAFDDKVPDALTLTWGRNDITFRAGKEAFTIKRTGNGEQGATADG